MQYLHNNLTNLSMYIRFSAPADSIPDTVESSKQSLTLFFYYSYTELDIYVSYFKYVKFVTQL